MEGPGCPLMDAGSTLQLSPTFPLVCISNSIAGFKMSHLQRLLVWLQIYESAVSYNLNYKKGH